MNWRRPTDSLRVRLALALSVLTLTAAALAFLVWQTPDAIWLAAGLIAALLVIQYSIVARFTRFVPLLTTWAREFARNNDVPSPQLADTGVPEVRELSRSLDHVVNAVRHQGRALSETQELLEYSEQRLQKW